MNFEFLAPGMQHAEEANFRAETFSDCVPLREEFQHWYGTRDRRGLFLFCRTRGAKRLGSVKTTCR